MCTAYYWYVYFLLLQNPSIQPAMVHIGTPVIQENPAVEMNSSIQPATEHIGTPALQEISNIQWSPPEEVQQTPVESSAVAAASSTPKSNVGFVGKRVLRGVTSPKKAKEPLIHDVHESIAKATEEKKAMFENR